MLRFTLTLICFLSLLSCSKRRPPAYSDHSEESNPQANNTPPSQEDIWAHEWWLSKVTRSLRGGQGLQGGDKIRDLLSKSRVDGDYLDYLAEEFSKNRAVDSVAAIKQLVARIALSQSFSTPNPNPTECYDHRPGYVEAPGSPPCQIASILQKNCVSCHIGMPFCLSTHPKKNSKHGRLLLYKRPSKDTVSLKHCRGSRSRHS